MGDYHKDLPMPENHVPCWFQDTDPGAVGAGHLWVHPDTGVAQARNDDDDDWIPIGRQAEAHADSTATDTAGIVSDFNGLLAKLRAVGLLEDT